MSVTRIRYLRDQWRLHWEAVCAGNPAASGDSVRWSSGGGGRPPSANRTEIGKNPPPRETPDLPAPGSGP